MKAAQIVESLKTRKGQHVKMIWQRGMKTRADVPMKITKRTTAFVRAGIEYANLSSVKNAVESGERDEVGALKWGQWVERPFIISHKDQEYLRLYPASLNNMRTTTEFFIDERPATADEVKPYVLASEFRERDEDLKCFTIKVANLVHIGE